MLQPDPCPLCGGEAKVVQPVRAARMPYNVSCEACNLVLIGDTGESRGATVARWNFRKPLERRESG